MTPTRPAGVRFGAAAFKGQSVVRHPGKYVVVFAGVLHGAPAGRIRITLTGPSVERGRIELTAGSVTYTQGSSSFRGRVTTIRGDELGATLAGRAGRIRMVAHLTVARSHAFTGRVTLS